MYIRIICAGALAAGMAAIPSLSLAQSMACGERAGIIDSLGAKYGETRRGGGLAGPTAIFELFASEKTGTWTILRTGTNGLSCVMAVGEGWQNDAQPVAVSGDPT